MDARGATINYVYDNRGLTTQVSTTSPNTATIPITPTVTMSYDNLGNRTSMTDGLGTQTYEYNQLSRLTAETRSFTDSLPNAPLANNSFRLEYSYSISGQLKSYKDPYNRQFDFGFDKVGRNTSIDGTAYAGVTSYSANQQYRAFGSLKQVSYGNATTATMTYNNRLQPNSYRLNDATQTLFGKDYIYTTANNNDNDGLLKKSVHYDATMTANEQAKRNQVNTYDAQGRIKTSYTGEPNLTPFGQVKNGHFQQTYIYDAFGNLTNKNDMDFGLNQIGCTKCPRGISYSETITNNRTQNSLVTANGSPSQSVTNYQYNAEGQLVNRGGNLSQFDVAGQLVFGDATGTNPDDTISFDGNGDRGKWIQTGTPGSFYYYLRSSVFGDELLQMDSSGAMFLENVYSPTGANIAYFKNNEVFWKHEEPSGKEKYYLKQDRTATSSTYDPTGTLATNVGYDGGHPCPPQTCSSPQNSTIPGPYTQGFDATDRLNQMKGEFREKTLQFDILFASFKLGVSVSTSNENNSYKKKRKPTLVNRGQISDGEKKERDAIANTGIFDNEALDKPNVDPPDPNASPFERMGAMLRLSYLLAINVKIVGFTKSQTEDISNRVWYMFNSKACVDAFRSSQGPDGKPLPTPAEMVRDKRLLIVNYNTLAYYNKDVSDFGITEDARKGLLNAAAAFLPKGGDAYTTSPNDPKLASFPVVTVLFGSNFDPNGGNNPFHEVMVHERLHGSGVETNQTFWQWLAGSHDLSNFPNYDNIIKACSPEGEKK